MTPKTLLPKTVGLALLAVLLANVRLTAQIPGPIALPGSGTDDAPPDVSFSPGGSETRGPIPEPQSQSLEEIFPGSVYEPATPTYLDEDYPQYDLWDGHPAPTESSGTWLQRGFWFAEADAVIMNRYWDRRDLVVATDDGNTDNPNAIQVANGVFVALPATLAQTRRLLYIKGRHPGADGSVRLTLGRFLFRDCSNRDHTVEFSAFGGGDFVQDCGITPRQGQLLFVPFPIDGTNLADNSLSLDGATSMNIDYSSRFKNFEVNYRVKTRMGKDQMVLQPSGEWIRRATTSWTRQFLAGLRFFDLSERLTFSGTDVITPNGNSDGSLLIRTDNNLVGFQLGAGHAYETGRWSVSAEVKGGVFATDAKGRNRYILENNPDRNYNNRAAEDQISFIGESRLIGRWHLRPNLSLRAGYEALYVTSVALAPAQINFDPVFSKLATSGDPFYHGASFGLEGYW